MLARTATPYIGQSVLFSAITLFSLGVALKTSQWNLLWAMLGASLLWMAQMLYFGLKYRVGWDASGVHMWASGLKNGPRTIPYDEISSIHYEIAGAGNVWPQSRPFRRVAIYDKKERPATFIDVSLRHFRLRDIDELLKQIRTKRPELHVPSILENGKPVSPSEFERTPRK